MPGMNGIQLQDALRGAGQNIPVIFITGAGDEEARKATRHILNPIVLQKPFSPDVLVEAINQSLSAATVKV